MDQYLVIGSDGKEFGPVDLAGVQQWVREGRVLKGTRVRKNDGPAVAAESLAELAATFAPPPPPNAVTPPMATAVPIPSEFRSWAFIGQAWELFKPHWLPLCLMFVIMFVIGAAIGQIPLVGSCVGFALNAGFMIGINRAILGVLAGQPPQVEMMFRGFDRFLHAFLGAAVSGLAVLGAVAPIVGPIVLAVFYGRLWERPGFIELAVLGALVAGVIASFVGILFCFTSLVLAETDHDFWTAIKTSIALTKGYRWSMFCLVLAVTVVGIAGLLVCCIGVVAAQAIGAVTLALVYRFLQSKQPAPVVA